MKKVFVISLISFTFATCQVAFAETVNVTNSVTDINQEAGIANIKKVLSAACQERGGTTVEDSFEIIFEKTNPNKAIPKPYYVDGAMKCNLK